MTPLGTLSCLGSAAYVKRQLFADAVNISACSNDLINVISAFVSNVYLLNNSLELNV